MPAPWSTNGSRCRAAGIRSPGSRRSWRARIISWLCQSPLILHDADLRFYRRFLRSLTRQVRYLRGTAGDARDGVPRLQARIALVYAVLCMAEQIGHLRSATRRLVNELERQILPDGGHISRNPGVIIEILLDLLPLSQAFTARNVAPPPALINAIDRMMPMLRFFRHGDGTFALFNGMGPTPPDLLATVLAYDDARGTPVANAPYSGYQRIDAGATVVLMDTGVPPPPEVSADAHAGCLVVRILQQAAAHRRQLRHAGQRQGELAPGRARDRGPFHRHLQRHLVVPVSRFGRVPPAVRHPDRRRSGQRDRRPRHRGRGDRPARRP